MTPPSAHCAGPWGWHSTPALFDTLLLTATKVIPSFTRLAIVRWYLDTEPDVHFRLRPYLTRRTPCRCGCGVLTSFYPDGLRAGAVAPSHLSPLYGWRIPSLPDTPTAFDRFFSSPPHPPLPPPLCPTWTPRGQVPSPTLDFLPAPLRRLLACPCILCNQGDTTLFSTGSSSARSPLWRALCSSTVHGPHDYGSSPNPRPSRREPSWPAFGLLLGSFATKNPPQHTHLPLFTWPVSL